LLDYLEVLQTPPWRHAETDAPWKGRRQPRHLLKEQTGVAQGQEHRAGGGPQIWSSGQDPPGQVYGDRDVTVHPGMVLADGHTVKRTGCGISLITKTPDPGQRVGCRVVQTE
jgi:hypothetical protein